MENKDFAWRREIIDYILKQIIDFIVKKYQRGTIIFINSLPSGGI
jgi:hypothetical protein